MGMYDRSKDLEWKIIKDVSFFGAMIRGNRGDVDSRFLSKFNTFTFDIPTDATISYIYTSILKGHLTNFSADVILVADPVVNMTINLFKVFSIDFRLV